MFLRRCSSDDASCDLQLNRRLSDEGYQPLRARIVGHVAAQSKSHRNCGKTAALSCGPLVHAARFRGVKFDSRSTYEHSYQNRKRGVRRNSGSSAELRISEPALADRLDGAQGWASEPNVYERFNWLIIPVIVAVKGYILKY